MKVERNRAQQAARRAEVHAALGDPHRLAAAELLALGDESPGALADRLGLGSNLLAHHLRVLEEAGVVERLRSEGDARRSYVRIRLEDPDVARLLPPPRLRDVRRLLFVCTHNSARSQLAAATWRAVSEVPAVSAGTDPAARVHPRAVRVAARHGLGLDDARTRRVEAVQQPGDLVVAVCDNAFEELSGVRSRPELHWSVPDPVRTGTGAAFEAAFAGIRPRVTRLADALTPPVP